MPADVSQKRKSRTVSTAEMEELTSLTEQDITTSKIMELFGDIEGKGVRFNPYDIVVVPKGKLEAAGSNGKVVKNTDQVVTTVGALIFNKFFILHMPTVFAEVGWQPDIMTKKKFNGINQQLTYGVLEDRVDIQEYKSFCNRAQKFMPYVSILANNHTDKMLTITKIITPAKKKLLAEHADEIAKGDLHAAQVIDEISAQLLDLASKELEDDPSMDMFNSGVGGDYGNNFKNMFVMRGAVKDPDPAKGYNIITSNFVEGISKDEYSKIANTLAAGPYARSKKTEMGGYWEKLFKSAFQHIYAMPEGTDCGTDKYITVKLTPKNIDAYMYNYIIEGDRLVELTSRLREKYLGQTVKFRFSSMCRCKEHGGICHKCLGNLFYREGIRNIGTATPQLPSKLKVLSMKLFHDDQVRFAHMDPMKAFYPDKYM